MHLFHLSPPYDYVPSLSTLCLLSWAFARLLPSTIPLTNKHSRRAFYAPPRTCFLIHNQERSVAIFNDSWNFECIPAPKRALYAQFTSTTTTLLPPSFCTKGRVDQPLTASPPKSEEPLEPLASQLGMQFAFACFRTWMQRKQAQTQDQRTNDDETLDFHQ